MSTTLRLGTLLAVVLALITAALPAATARAGDPPKPATIVGVVLTKTDGKLVPVPHAKVAIKRSDNITQETIANAKGEFSFAKVVPGQAVILATGPRSAAAPSASCSARVKSSASASASTSNAHATERSHPSTTRAARRPNRAAGRLTNRDNVAMSPPTRRQTTSYRAPPAHTFTKIFARYNPAATAQ